MGIIIMANTTNNYIAPEILELINSSKLFEAMEKIGNSYGLLIDQIGQLESDTRLVLVGEIKSNIFTDTIAKNLEISQSTATKIVADVNTQIFVPLKEAMRKTQEEAAKKADAEAIPIVPSTAPVTPPTAPAAAPVSAPAPQIPIAPIEKAGDFMVQRPSQSSSPLYKDTGLNREAVLSDLENIMKLRPENAENYVEHLIANPVPVRSISRTRLIK
jgi:hypothetical protein